MTFLLSALAHPLQVGAVAPSSSSVGQAFVDLVEDRRPVLELGGGDGCISRALLEAVGPDDLTVVELNPFLHRRLSAALPCPVLRADAAYLRAAIQRSGLPRPQVIVSTIPMRLMSQELVAKIAAEYAAVLTPGGVVLQICYDIVPPIPRGSALVGRRVAYVSWNLPPATIWMYARPGELPSGKSDQTGLYAGVVAPIATGVVLGALTEGTTRVVSVGLGLAAGAVQALRGVTAKEDPKALPAKAPMFRVVPAAQGVS